jgi:hypothetical protein
MATDESRRNSYEFGLGLIHFDMDERGKKVFTMTEQFSTETISRQMRNLIDGKRISNEVI